MIKNEKINSSVAKIKFENIQIMKFWANDRKYHHIMKHKSIMQNEFKSYYHK